MKNKKDYLIKYGKLKNIYVSEAFKKGEIEELVKVKEFLTSNFSKNPNYAEKILEGIIAIDSFLLPEYTRLMNLFLEKVDKLEKKEQNVVRKKLNLKVLEENDILYLKKILDEIKN